MVMMTMMAEVPDQEVATDPELMRIVSKQQPLLCAIVSERRDAEWGGMHRPSSYM
jgi:hypothetical protein